MTIAVGDAIPAVKVMQASAEGPRELDTAEFFRGRTVALFGVPGAFTPTCSAKHLPNFLQHAKALREKGVDVIACLAVNDAFVLQEWANSQGITDQVVMIADGSALLTRAMGLEFDLTARGLGVRSQRFALLARDGRVTHIGVEPPGGFEVSRAEALLAVL